MKAPNLMNTSGQNSILEGKPSASWFSNMMRPAPSMGKISSGHVRPQPPVSMAANVQRQMASVAMATTLAVGIAAAPANAADIGNGKQIFEANCAACHAGGMNVIQVEKTLQKEALEQYLAGGLKESSIITQVTNGKNSMPAFGGRLGDDEIQDVAAYVYDTATGNKWADQ